jgi:hypothetical protein
MCTLSAVQTLTGKTITNPVIGDIRGVLDVVNVKNSLGNVTNLEINNSGCNIPTGSTYKINGTNITSNLVTTNTAQTITNKSFDDTTCLFQNTADTSKK